MNTSSPASNVLKFRLLSTTDTSDTNTSGSKSVCAQGGGDMTANKLLSQMERVASWDDLAWFVVALLEDYEKNPYQWNNCGMYPFLDAMASCIQQKDERYENYDKPFSEDQPWKIFAEILYAAKTYE